jgi:hypothetical protein
MVGKKKMSWCRQLPALIIVLALTGCAPAPSGLGTGPERTYPSDDPRDTSGMH